MKYYTEEECRGALQRATNTINELTKRCENYTRGTNDCFALLAEYDKELRGSTKARDYINFQWKSTREFSIKLARQGYTLGQYMEYCGYQIIMNNKPLLGDIAFKQGAMINDGAFWVSTKDDNTGAQQVVQSHFLETNLVVLARPIRS